jgi:hypothetical protein
VEIRTVNKEFPINKAPRAMEAIFRNFSMPLLVWNPPKSPPKVAESPEPRF